jgi:hypothetical protein
MSPVLNKTMRFLAFRAVFPLLLALLAPAAAVARGTLDSILPEIRAAHPGRLSDAEPWTDGEGNTHYRIKWMTPEGRILFFDADARTGRYGAAGGDAWRNHGGGRGENEMGGQGEHRNHWNGDDGNGGGDDWRNHDGNGRDNDGPWTRGGGDWRDRGGNEWRNRGNGGGNWRDRPAGGNWGHGNGGGNHHHGGQ